MDNFTIEVWSDSKTDFALAMQIAFRNSKKCVGYRIDKEKGLVLMSSKRDIPAYVALPYEMNLEQTIEFAWGWIKANRPEGSAPDHDGDNNHGFKMLTNGWGQVDSYQEFIAIKPIWAMYGK
jgi:hypothetical protein